MSNIIKLNKGLDLPLKGEAEKKVLAEVKPDCVAVKPGDFKGLVPKLLVKEGDSVKAGSPLMADKMNPDILLTSPVSGTVQSIVRGEKRKLLAVVVKAGQTQEYEEFAAGSPAALSADAIRSTLLKSGLWASIIQRPYGVVANPTAAPKAVFVSASCTAPCAPDVDFVLEGQSEYVSAGIDALAKVSCAPVHFCISAEDYAKSPLKELKNVVMHVFEGKHPAGNVGVLIHNISPILKGETVWTVTPLMLAAIGKLFATGKLDLSRLIAVTGPAAAKTGYVKAVAGIAVKDLAEFIPGGNVRIVSGDVLSGEAVGTDGFLGFQDNQVSVLAEGDYREMFGWMNPVRSKVFSASRAYFSWLCPRKKYAMDTNTHGGVRAFMFNNVYSDVLPMHIFPVYLAKACLAQDIDKMEKFGIYEVLPEDLATCEFVCPSKIEWQDIIASGIALMMKEMA